MNLAIIGCGERGAMYAEAAVRAGLTVSVCADVSERRARALARLYGAKASVRCKRVPGSKGVEAVAIATPTDSHAAYVLASARAGKHVLCEAPFAYTSADVRDCVAAVRNAGIVCRVADELSLRPERLAIAAHVDSANIGKVGSLRVHRTGPMPRGTANWYRDYERSGGVAFEGLVDEYGWISSVFGKVKKVFCQNLQRPGLDYAMVTLTLDTGIIAQVIGSWAEPPGSSVRHRIEVCATGGMIQHDTAEHSLNVSMRSGADVSPIPNSPIAESPMDRHLAAFLGAISRGENALATLSEAFVAVRIGEAVLESASTGKAVRI